MRVLLVEDDVVSQTAYGAMIRSAGCDLRAVSTMAGAMQEALWAELVVLDLGLPDADPDEPMAGLMALRALNPQVSVVILSASEPPDDVGEWIRAGAEDWIVKGRITPQGMQRVVHTQRDRRWRQIMEHALLPAVNDIADKIDRFVKKAAMA